MAKLQGYHYFVAHYLIVSHDLACLTAQSVITVKEIAAINRVTGGYWPVTILYINLNKSTYACDTTTKGLKELRLSGTLQPSSHRFGHPIQIIV